MDASKRAATATAAAGVRQPQQQQLLLGILCSTQRATRQHAACNVQRAFWASGKNLIINIFSNAFHSAYN